MSEAVSTLKAVTVEPEESKSLFGFWIYIMTDCVLFASLFATYAVLHGNTYGGPGAKELFSLNFILAETLILLTSSFVCGLAMSLTSAAKRSQTLLETFAILSTT